MKTWFGEEMEHRCCRVEGNLISEKGETEREVLRDTHKPLLGKMRRAHFCEVLQQVGLQDWNCKGS